MVTGDNLLLHGATGGYNWFLEGYKGLQELKGVTRSNRWLQGVTGGYRGFEGITKGYRGVTIGYRMVNNYNIKLFTCATHAQQKLMVGRSLATTLEAIWCSLSACKIF